MNLTGELLIGASARRGQGAEFHAVDAATEQALQAPTYYSAKSGDVDEACVLAESAFDAYRTLPAERRARFLDDIAARIEALGDALIERAMSESG